MSELEVDGEVLAEEDAEPRRRRAGAGAAACPTSEAAVPVLRAEVRSAAIAAAGGVLAGAATVAAVRAVSAVGSQGRAPRAVSAAAATAANVVASRSFLVDVHLLGR